MKDVILIIFGAILGSACSIVANFYCDRARRIRDFQAAVTVILLKLGDAGPDEAKQLVDDTCGELIAAYASIAADLNPADWRLASRAVNDYCKCGKRIKHGLVEGFFDEPFLPEPPTKRDKRPDLHRMRDSLMELSRCGRDLGSVRSVILEFIERIEKSSKGTDSTGPAGGTRN